MLFCRLQVQSDISRAKGMTKRLIRMYTILISILVIASYRITAAGDQLEFGKSD